MQANTRETCKNQTSVTDHSKYQASNRNRKNSISVYPGIGNCGYKFFHAAESTDDYPVLAAKDVDEYGKYFEEKINVKQINPYNTSTLELHALAHFQPGENTIENPYDCMQGQEKGLQERFNFVSGSQTLIMHGRESVIQGRLLN